MGKRGAGITVKVKKPFHNESYFANMSYYFCGDLVPQDEEFDICYWEKKDDIVEQIWNKLESRPDYFTDTVSGKHVAKLGVSEIGDILSVLFESLCTDWVQTESSFWWTKKQICSLVYVETLLNQGLVEVEWYDWW